MNGTVGANRHEDRAEATRRLLGRAFSQEIGRLELLRTQAWQVMSAFVFVCGAVVFFFDPDARIGKIPLVGSAVALAWFSFVRYWLALQRWTSALAWGSIVIEQTAPWAFYAGLALTGTSEHIVNGWGPVFVYAGAQTLGMLKLNPRYSFATGALGALQYILVTVVIVEPAFDVDGRQHTANFGIATRALYIFGAGIVWSYVTRGLREAVGGIASTVRQNDLFGKYRLERELASGGMGVVWLATYCPEGGFERPAAVKLVHAHLAKDSTFIDAFRREAELGARLVHSHIVQVFDFGVINDRYFLAMEYVDGITLRGLMDSALKAKMAIPPAVAGSVIRALLAGLGFAHSQARGSDGVILRIIHRDLAPSNILIDRGGSVKVTDFGIARALRGRATEQTETVAGHFSYMAPEQGSAALLDERTDLFCVGILLWEMLAGQSLFRRTNEAATLLAVAIGVIPAPSSLDPSLAPWDALCARALAREPAERFCSAEEMSQAIRAVVGEADEGSIASFVASLSGAGPASSNSAQVSAAFITDTDTTKVDRMNEATIPGRG